MKNRNYFIYLILNNFIIVVSLPKLADFDWRVDVKTSSDAITRMSMPTCLVQFKVCKSPLPVLIAHYAVKNNTALSHVVNFTALLQHACQ